MNEVIKNVKDIPFEIIVVINKCDDIDNIDDLKIDRRIKIIELEKNIGFGRANNVGFKNSSGEYICIINPDTYIESNTIDYLVNKLEVNSEIGLCNCKILEEDGTIQKTVFIKKYNLTFLICELFFIFKIPIIKQYLNDYFVSDKSEYLKMQAPDTISGAFMLFRESVYRQINGFDEHLFMYGEDIDISLRTKKISEVIYFPQVSLTHIGASSLGKEQTEKKLSMIYESLIYTSNKHWGNKKTLLLKCLLLLNAIIFSPFSFFLRKDIHKQLIKNRSKVFIKLFFIPKSFNSKKVA